MGLAFLKISQPEVQESPYDESSLKQRKYTYQVSFLTNPGAGSFSGRIWAVDPWTGATAPGILVSHRASQPIVVVPSCVTLDVRGSSGTAQAELTILTKHSMPRLVVEPSNEGSKIVEISEKAQETATRLRRFVVHAKPDGVRGQERLSIVVRESPGAGQSVVIPVAIRSVSP